MVKNKKHLIYAILILLYIIIVVGFVRSNEKIGFVLNSSAYTQYEYELPEVISGNSCVLTEANEIEITGEDAYIYIQIPCMPVGFVSVDIFEEYGGTYQIYYAMDTTFSEVNSVRNMKEYTHIFSIGETINSIRLDFDGVSVGDKYVLKESPHIFFNVVEEEFSENLCSIIFIWSFYIVGSIVYMLFLQYKRRLLAFLLTYIYSIVINYAWLSYISKQMDIVRSVVLLVIVSLGMFFWGNNMYTEEIKWEKE